MEIVSFLTNRWETKQIFDSSEICQRDVWCEIHFNALSHATHFHEWISLQSIL